MTLPVHDILALLTDADIRRFWAGVDQRQPLGCWDWQRAIVRGYGKFKVHGLMLQAHRVAFALTSPSVQPAELLVCHRCDRRRCCNPGHLFLGTTADNMRDMVAKGRQARGERHGFVLHPETCHRKLSADDVAKMLHMFDAGASKAGAGRAFSVSANTLNSYLRKRERAGVIR